MQIKPATKFRQYARVCFWGTEKAGKSHIALALATLLAGESGKIGVISSEYASSQLLQHRFPHDIIDLAEVDENGHIAKDAFSTSRYEQAIKLFCDAGYQVVVIDSLSHLWEGEGGILDAVKNKGNTFNEGWGENSPLYRKVIHSILAARCHIIITLRAKDNYVQQEYLKKDGTKGMGPVNVGLAPVMRKNFGYEMHLKIRMENMIGYVEATAMQDYIPRGEEIEVMDEDFANRLLGALDGVPLPEPTEQQKAMRTLLDEFYNLAPLTYAKIPNWEQMALRAAFGISKGTSLPQDYTDEHITLMRTYVEAKKRPARQKREQSAAPATEEPPVDLSLDQQQSVPSNGANKSTPAEQPVATANPAPVVSGPDSSKQPSLDEQIKQAKIRAQKLGLACDASEWANLLKTCQVQSIASAADLAKVNGHMTAFEREQQAASTNAQVREPHPTQPRSSQKPAVPASELQRASIKKLCALLDCDLPEMHGMTEEKAGQTIRELSAAYNKSRGALPVR
jgi:hypothetical protein